MDCGHLCDTAAHRRHRRIDLRGHRARWTRFARIGNRGDRARLAAGNSGNDENADQLQAGALRRHPVNASCPTRVLSGLVSVRVSIYQRRWSIDWREIETELRFRSAVSEARPSGRATNIIIVRALSKLPSLRVGPLIKKASQSTRLFKFGADERT